MKALLTTALCLLLAGALNARDSADRITPEMQAVLDAQKRVVASWAASGVIVAAVKEQNARGPIPNLTNRAWKRLQPDDALVRSFRDNAAGKWLARKVAGGQGLYREAFLSAAAGEKVAFAGKPSSYLHAGEEKFTLPMSGRIWQGKPEFDKSSRSYAIQLAAPVLSGGRPIGVLVVGVSMKEIKTMAE